ncbi:MAG: hypothetical protein NVSMB27_18630 [Ktedonobacteraceae bacterium]
MAALAFVSPILPGKHEAWRRFCQELLESRRYEYEQSRRQLGVTKELAWWMQTAQGEMAIVYLETEHPNQVFPRMAESNLPFDSWFRQQMLELHGLDITRSPQGPPNELIFVWQSSQ